MASITLPDGYIYLADPSVLTPQACQGIVPRTKTGLQHFPFPLPCPFDLLLYHSDFLFKAVRPLLKRSTPQTKCSSILSIFYLFLTFPPLAAASCRGVARRAKTDLSRRISKSEDGLVTAYLEERRRKSCLIGRRRVSTSFFPTSAIPLPTSKHLLTFYLYPIFSTSHLLSLSHLLNFPSSFFFLRPPNTGGDKPRRYF
jgi:hypothetical protein